MLIDQYLPDYHFNEVHSLEIANTPQKIYPLLWQTDFNGSRIIKALFALRGLPFQAIQIKTLCQHGFILLEEKKDREIVMGLVGRFWKMNGALQNLLAVNFNSFAEPGFAKAAWNFALSKNDRNTCTLSTETRIFCTDEQARRNFTRYWFFIKPFSGLVRKQMLRCICKESENTLEAD
ncbi:MAG: hypothetical protein ACE5HS_22090 [bacterium]